MTRYCTNCGAELQDGFAFCTQCGTPVTAPPDAPPQNAEQAAERTTEQAVPEQPIYRQPPYQQQYRPQDEEKPAPGGKYSVLSTGEFFGLLFLFCLPVIGWIACTVFAFVSKNENRKHFARAVLIWLLIGVVLAFIISLIFFWIGNAVFINVPNNGRFHGIPEFYEHFQEFENGGFNDLPIS